MPRTLLICVLVLASGITNLASSRRCDSDLRQEVERFYSYLSHREHYKMWRMVSKSMKKANNNDAKEYVREFQKQRFKLQVRINKVDVRGKRANVSIQISILADTNEVVTSEESEVDWVLENGCWRYNGVISTKEHTPEEESPSSEALRIGPPTISWR